MATTMSSVSETLHCVVRSPRDGEALALASAVAASGDALLLLQDGVWAVVAQNIELPPGVSGYALASDLARRGIVLPASSAFSAVDDAGFVDLAANSMRQVCWA